MQLVVIDEQVLVRRSFGVIVGSSERNGIFLFELNGLVARIIVR